ncbi:MAG TPA: hypothetical protein VG982_01940 [Candidatus Paceibacterota bacterium]|jgi:hypothetical protein|nr:hypothetical protein [Candidatus Paceibacterota bacterium]
MKKVAYLLIGFLTVGIFIAIIEAVKIGKLAKKLKKEISLWEEAARL